MFLLSFKVTGETLQSTYKRLQSEGIECYTEPLDLPLKGYGTVKAIIFEDPDGIMTELMQLPTAAEVQHYRK